MSRSALLSPILQDKLAGAFVRSRKQQDCLLPKQISWGLHAPQQRGLGSSWRMLSPSQAGETTTPGASVGKRGQRAAGHAFLGMVQHGSLLAGLLPTLGASLCHRLCPCCGSSHVSESFRQ